MGRSDENEKPDQEHGNDTEAAALMGAGIAVGISVGVATNNLALWTGVGVAMGVALAADRHKKRKGTNDRD